LFVVVVDFDCKTNEIYEMMVLSMMKRSEGMNHETMRPIINREEAETDEER
jgi:hypothetical protein